MDEMQQVRPVHTVVDCTAQTTVHTPLSDAEVAAQGDAMAVAERVEVERLAAEGVLRAQVAAHPDPLVQALAARVFGTPGTGGN